MTTTPTAESCPRCAKPTVALGLPRRWCPACEWNLDETPVVVGWKWLDRPLHRAARRLTERQFTALADGPLTRRSMTGARAVTLGAALVLMAGVLAIAALGLWLIGFGHNVIAAGLGLILLGVAVVLRPRLGRLRAHTEDAYELDRSAAPELFGLVERVAAAVGAPAPDVVLFGYAMNAYTTTVGLRRRRVLHLGLPLWATLEPAERVALIGHELGHFVNGDVRRGPLVLMTETTLARLSAMFEPAGPAPGGAIEMLTHAVGWAVSRIAMTLQIGLFAASQRDSQRAEYLADELGARAGGSAAAIRLADHLLLHPALDTVISRESRAGNGLPAWRAAAATAVANQAANVPLLRRISRRNDASLFASHPPSGLRAEMLERRPRHAAAVTLDEATVARIDQELGPFPERVRRVLADGGLAPKRRRLG